MENLRDISKYNDNIKTNLIFRSAEPFLNDISNINDLNIKTIIDLRTKDEISDTDYSYSLPSNIQYNNVPIQIESKKNKYSGTPMESVYHYFSNDCKNIFISILKNNTILKRCIFDTLQTWKR
jgi:hypothetical protein